jgi:hypothetical protein
VTKVFRVQDAVEVGFPGTRTIIRTYREVWQTRKTGKKDKHGRDIRKCVGKPTKEAAWHVSSLDPDSRSAEKFAEIVGRTGTSRLTTASATTATTRTSSRGGAT